MEDCSCEDCPPGSECDGRFAIAAEGDNHAACWDALSRILLMFPPLVLEFRLLGVGLEAWKSANEHHSKRLQPIPGPNVAVFTCIYQ